MAKRTFSIKKEVPTSVATEPRYVWSHTRPLVYTHNHQEVFGTRLSQSEIKQLLETYPYMIDFFTKE